MTIEEDNVKEESDMVDYIKRNNDFKCYFFVGGRHQTVVDGGIVYEYLQNCTDTSVQILGCWMIASISKGENLNSRDMNI